MSAPVGRMSSTRIEGEARDKALTGHRNAALDRPRRMARLNELRAYAPTQNHPRECRCDRSLFVSGACLKCGLPAVWEPAEPTARLQIAEVVQREDESLYRRARARRLRNV